MSASPGVERVDITSYLFATDGFSMSVIQVGLVDTTGALDPELVQSAAAAFNLQVIRDLSRFWNTTATVIYLPHVKKIPSGVWPIQLVKTLSADGGGFHLDKHKQPYAKVIATPDNDGWTIAASHEILEMLVDPYGNRLQTSIAIEVSGNKIKDNAGQFAYLVEACAPCQADNYGYSIRGVAVSDFLTPRYYDPIATPGTLYSFTGAIKAPRQILPGGYISWVNQETEEWQQLHWPDAAHALKIIDPGKVDGKKSLREWIDARPSATGLQTTPKISQNPANSALLAHCKQHRMSLDRIAAARAKLYQ